MATRKRQDLNNLEYLLFVDRPGMKAFAVLDGASVPELPGTLESLSAEFKCLFRGQLTPKLAKAAPYLVIIPSFSRLADWLVKEGWGHHWGILGHVPDAVDFNTLRRHFRKLTKAQLEGGGVVFFRFYDPRVWRIYLPTCNADELETVFGPVASYFCEGDQDYDIQEFSASNGQLSSMRWTFANPLTTP